jgi:hypothetical protein
MIGVIVTLGPGEGLDRAKAAGIAGNASSMFEGMPGLRSKVFTWDAGSDTARNVYVWDSEDAARGFFSDDTRKLIVDLYGVEPDIRFVEIAALVDNAAAVVASP